MRYEVAPLEGVTTWLFRQTHQSLFGGADQYYTPFFSPPPEHHMTPKERRELAPEHNAGLPVTPQVMARRPEDFLWGVEQLRDMGYKEVNLNLGCPSGTVTAKGKGAGFLTRPDELDAFFDAVCPRACLPVSVKTRLGWSSPAEFPRLLEIFNRYPLTGIIVHARVRQDLYRGPVDWDAFAAALADSRHPLTYNGDLVTVGDVAAFAARFPQVETVMLGRGAVADPALLRKLRGGEPATRQELRDYTQRLYAGYQAAFGQTAPAAQRMKELWFYLIHLFDGGERIGGKMRRVKTPAEYEALEARIFQDLALLPEARGGF